MKKTFLSAIAIVGMMVAVAAQSQVIGDPPLSEETIRLQTLRDIVVKQSDVIVKQNDTLQIALQRIPIGGMYGPPPVQPQAVVDPANISTACSSTGGFDIWRCGFQLLASPAQGTVEIVKALAAPAASVYGAKVQARAGVEIAKVNSIAAIEQSRESNATLRTAFGAVAAAGSTPTQVNTITDSQGISIGGGPVTWAPITDSNKQTNPAPRVCVPTFSATGAITGYSCS